MTPKNNFRSLTALEKLTRRRGVVYVIRMIGTNFYKVGFCKRRSGVATRVSTLQVGNPIKLQVVAIIEPATKANEKTFHVSMAQSEILGEWFSFNPTLKWILESYKTGTGTGTKVLSYSAQESTTVQDTSQT